MVTLAQPAVVLILSRGLVQNNTNTSSRLSAIVVQLFRNGMPLANAVDLVEVGPQPSSVVCRFSLG